MKGMVLPASSSSTVRATAWRGRPSAAATGPAAASAVLIVSSAMFPPSTPYPSPTRPHDILPDFGHRVAGIGIRSHSARTMSGTSVLTRDRHPVAYRGEAAAAALSLACP